MDTERFELTGEERSQVIQRDTTLWCPTKGEFLDEVGAVIAKAQVSKVLSLLEPVELEALTDEEIIAEYESWTDINPDDEYQMKGLKGISQATIQHNQSKGQLFRVKE